MGLAFFMKIFFNHNGRKVLKQSSQSIRYAELILSGFILYGSKKTNETIFSR
jgi:hypothetical protein